MDRRMKEHKRYYKQDVEVLGTIAVTSEFTTLRVEKLTKQEWQENHPDWEYLRNDRFIIPEDVKEIEIKVRKTYKFAVAWHHAPQGKDNNMKVIEKLFLTKHERYILTKTYNLIDDIYIDTSDTDVENTAHELTKILDNLLKIVTIE